MMKLMDVRPTAMK
jgi:hypothetical protein